jgi:hypothetical protein
MNEKAIEPSDNFAHVTVSTYIFSHNGDRPEHYRHYGLGTVPITELDPIFHRHLREGQVRYKTQIVIRTIWDKRLIGNRCWSIETWCWRSTGWNMYR